MATPLLPTIDQSLMPRKLLRRWVPDARKIQDIKCLKWLAPLLRDSNLFHLNRQSVSRAFFVGLFTAFLPMPGQTVAAALLALCFRANLPISMALIWLTNPITMAPVLYACYELGLWVLGTEPASFHFEMSFGWLFNGAKAIWWPLLTGSLIAGLTVGFIGWLSIRLLWHWHVVRNWEARKRNRSRRKPFAPQEDSAKGSRDDSSTANHS